MRIASVQAEDEGEMSDFLRRFRHLIFYNKAVKTSIMCWSGDVEFPLWEG